ncbi:MAG: diguanylate cyclase domain-containing protein [Acidimicrobiales bacterium]
MSRVGLEANMVVVNPPDAASAPSPAIAPSSALIGIPSGDLATLSTVVDECPTGVLVLEHGGRLVQANQAACRLLGLDARRLLAAHRSDYLDLGRHLDRLEAGGDSGPLRQLVVRPDGSSHFVLFCLRRLPDVGHPGRATVYLIDEGPADPIPASGTGFIATGPNGHSQAPGAWEAPAVSRPGESATAGNHLRGQAEVLRQIATGGPLESTLGRLTELASTQLNSTRPHHLAVSHTPGTNLADPADLVPVADLVPMADLVRVAGVVCAVIAERAGGTTSIFAGPGFPPVDPTALLDVLDPLMAAGAGTVQELDRLGGSGPSSPLVLAQLGAAGHRALVAVPVNALPPAGTAGEGHRAPRPPGERRATPPNLREALSDLAGLASPDSRPLGLLVCLLQAADALAVDELEVLRSSADLAAIALERDRSERDLASYALHDPLTGLANRNLLVDRLSQALNRAKRRHRNLALMFLDLDRFKSVNDSLGHHAGDLVLRQFGERLRLLVRPEDTVARFGGDEFVVLVEHVVDEQDAGQIAERVERAMAEPFVLDGRSLAVTVSVGIVIGNGEDDASTLLRKADAAMYRAKELGRNRTEVYDLALETRLANRSQLALDLRHAMADGLLQLWFRPLLAPGPALEFPGVPAAPQPGPGGSGSRGGGGSDGGSEELAPAMWVELRWADPDHAQLHTRDILALAEDGGQGLELAGWMMDTALEGLASLTRSPGWDPDRPLPRLVVPLTGPQLAHPELTDQMLRALRGWRSLGPNGDVALWVGVPEAGLSSGGDVAIRTLVALRRAGIGLALEEIGATPNSSLLSLLGRVTVDLLVVDASVVAALGEDPGPTLTVEGSTAAPPPASNAAVPASGATASLAARSLVAGLWGLGRGVGLAVAAAGVDHPSQRELLGRLRYNLAWGEAIAPAIAVDTLIARLAPGS